jgi:hypothetical protein
VKVENILLIYWQMSFRYSGLMDWLFLFCILFLFSSHFCSISNSIEADDEDICVLVGELYLFDFIIFLSTGSYYPVFYVVVVVLGFWVG